MTTEQILEAFDPKNASTISDEALSSMQHLSDEQIALLAKHYPNKPRGGAYLVLYDNSVEPNKQLFPLSTWQNLNNLRKFAGRKNLVAWSFKVKHAIHAEAIRAVQNIATVKANIVAKTPIEPSIDALRAEMEATVANSPANAATEVERFVEVGDPHDDLPVQGTIDLKAIAEQELQKPKRKYTRRS